MKRIAVAGLTLLTGCIPSVDAPPDHAPPPARAEFDRQTLDGGVTAPPAPAPAWKSRPVSPDAQTVAGGDYVVQSGDTLRAIAERTGAGSEAIARANGLAPPFTIRPGQRLAIPGGRYHLVRAGETGIAIARAYGVDWGRVVTANALAEPYILRVGQRVVIPGSGTPSTAERAAAFRLDIDDLVTGSEPAIADTQRPARPVTSPARPLPAVAQVATPTGNAGRFIWPVQGNVVRRFGLGESGERTNGIKIGAPIGTPVLAAADGIVAYAGSDIPSLGGLVILKHGSNLSTVYGHASRLLVTRGQAIKRGQTLALSGNSGVSARPELHFEVRQGRTPVDPLTRLPAR